MTEQRTNAAERSAHVERGAAPTIRPLELRDGVILPIADLRDEVAALRKAAGDLDCALSDLWRQGPQQKGDVNYLGAVDDAWIALRAVLAARD